ncbi:collagen alpha-1(I) chain-like [Papio anubis]|uniref:collagen alpha-1(I) chain-like n=1 Tax=Papio anubis TaxID=9555 RepID=UPI0012AE2AA2|nr:collagen alpha-1(I) chain-like [Papio anubis]
MPALEADGEARGGQPSGVQLRTPAPSGRTEWHPRRRAKAGLLGPEAKPGLEGDTVGENGLGAPPRDGVNGAARGRGVGGGGCEDSRSRAPGRRNTGARQGPFPPFLRFPTGPVDAEPAVGLERRLRVAVPREVSRPGLGPTPRWRSRGAVLELSCARAAARTPRTAHRRPQAGTPTTSLLTRRPARGWEREGCISVWGGGDSRLSAVGLGLAAEEPGLRGFPASRVRDFSTVGPVEARVGGYPPASSGRSRGATEGSCGVIQEAQ